MQRSTVVQRYLAPVKALETCVVERQVNTSFFHPLQINPSSSRDNSTVANYHSLKANLYTELEPVYAKRRLFI